MENRREIHKENRGIFYMVRDTIVSVSHLKFAMCIIIIAVRIKTVPELLFYVRSMNGMRKAILVKTGQEIDVIHLGIPVKYEISDDFADEFGNAFNYMIGENGCDFDSSDEYLNEWLDEVGEESFPCVLRVALFLTPGAAAVNDYVLYNDTMFKMCNDRTAISIGSIASGIVYNYDVPDLKVSLGQILWWDFDNNSDKISDWKDMGRIGFCPSLPAISQTWNELYDNLNDRGIYTRQFRSGGYWATTAEKLQNTGIECLIYDNESDDAEDYPYLPCMLCTVEAVEEKGDKTEITFKLVKNAKLAGSVDFTDNNNIATGFIISSYFEDHSLKKQEHKKEPGNDAREWADENTRSRSNTRRQGKKTGGGTGGVKRDSFEPSKEDATVNGTEELTSTSDNQSIWDIIEVGSTLLMGRYKQNDKAPRGDKGIEWTVLDKSGTSILVISKYALDALPYNNSFTEVTWETCSLRKWLNETFFSNAFSSDEQEAIRNTTVTADKNPSFGTSSGNNTTDKVFLLSITEVNKYFTSDSAKCMGTEYCNAQRALEDDSGVYWWLRSPGGSSNHAAGVTDYGFVDNYGLGVNYSNIAVRPALWIDLGI